MVLHQNSTRAGMYSASGTLPLGLREVKMCSSGKLWTFGSICLALLLPKKVLREMLGLEGLFLVSFF